jgi:hypothetical protein
MLSGRTISRASIINFLEAMREMGVLFGEERTGKGGHHWVYRAAMDEAEFKRFIASMLLESLMRDLPEETVEAQKDLISLTKFPSSSIFSNPNFHKTKVKSCPRFQPARSKVY